MIWVTRPEVDAELVMEYEARVNFLTPVYRCTLVCGYDLARISGGLSSLTSSQPTRSSS
jgi:hypothetical protein